MGYETASGFESPNGAGGGGGGSTTVAQVRLNLARRATQLGASPNAFDGGDSTAGHSFIVWKAGLIITGIEVYRPAAVGSASYIGKIWGADATTVLASKTFTAAANGLTVGTFATPYTTQESDVGKILHCSIYTAAGVFQYILPVNSSDPAVQFSSNLPGPFWIGPWVQVINPRRYIQGSDACPTNTDWNAGYPLTSLVITDSAP